MFTHKQQLFGLMLSASFALTALAGCNAPVPNTPAQQRAAADTSSNTADAFQASQDMDAYSTMADDESGPSAYQVEALSLDAQAKAQANASGTADTRVGGTLRAKVDATTIAAIKAKIEARKAALKAKLAARLAKLAGAKKKLHAAWQAAQWVDNGDGTKTKTVTFDDTKTLNNNTWVRHVKMVRTVNTQANAVVSSHEESSENATVNGKTVSRSSNRDKVLNADGSYTVTFHHERTNADGKKATIDWTKTIGADGGVTGTGTITTTTSSSTKTITLTLGGSEDKETATADDKDAGTTTTVTTSADGTATAQAKDDKTGQTSSVDVDDQEATAASADTDASASAGATASGTVSTGS